MILIFGKYKGKDLEEVPDSYLSWLVDSDLSWLVDSVEPIADEAQEELDYREKYNLKIGD